MITICVPSHKNPNELRRFLKDISEIRPQDLFELIIIDSGQCIETKHILQSHSSIIDKFISEPDGGIYDAFNKGAKIAECEWILFMGLDDRILSPSALKIQIEHLSKSLYSLISFPVALKINGKVIISKQFDRNNIRIPHMTCSHQGIFHKKTFLMENAFDPKMHIAADYKIVLQASLSNQIIGVTTPPAILMDYSGISSQGSSQLTLYRECLKSYAEILGVKPSLFNRSKFFLRSHFKFFYDAIYNKH